MQLAPSPPAILAHTILRFFGHGVLIAFVVADGCVEPALVPRETDAVQAALGFERVAAPPQAALAYRAVLQRWPASLLAAIGLANALHAGGNATGAAEVLLQAAQRHHSAVAWTNLARLRLNAGDLPGAEAAAREAVLRAQAGEPAWLAPAQQTLAQAMVLAPKPAAAPAAP